MDEKETISEVINLVEEAQKRNKFKLADAIKGRAYPEKSVVIYTDIVSARELYLLQNEMDIVAMKRDLDAYTELETKARELAATVQKSKLVFHMKGLGQEDVDRIGDEAQEGNTESLAWSKDYICLLIANSVQFVEDAEGNIDDHDITLEEAKELYRELPRESWELLVQAVEQLTLATGVFQGITDAGFLPKS